VLPVQPFLTAYDPSDLPGASIDPLGFDRGYTALAEQILPGLTNAAGRPRYLSVLCAAIALSDEQHKAGVFEIPRARYQRREAAVLRLERFWALACTLASRGQANLGTGGIRGLRDAERMVKKLETSRANETDANFRLLARQTQYGLFGIYANVAERLCLIERSSLSLGPHLGRRLAEAFLSETEVPRALRQAVVGGGNVSVSVLSSWGERAHVSAAFGKNEAGVLFEALQVNETRRRMAGLLERFPARGSADGPEPELSRLARIEHALAEQSAERDLLEALRAVRAYEDCYRTCVLAFFRLLWRVGARSPFELKLTKARHDGVLMACAESIRRERAELDAAYAGTSGPFLARIERLRDPVLFVRGAARAESVDDFIRCILDRHRNVQGAKRDGGRPKMPWLELRDEVLRPTLTAAQRVDGEPTRVDDVAPHVYRTHSADALRAGSTAS
jgi:hypothetical protein